MSAATLRRAASLMRDRAEWAHDGPWRSVKWQGIYHTLQALPDGAPWDLTHGLDRADAEHIASWHPAVAIAVAAMLETEAEMASASGPGWATDEAVAVARAYLGDL